MNKAIHYSQAVRLGSDAELIVLLYVIYEILKRHEKKFNKKSYTVWEMETQIKL